MLEKKCSCCDQYLFLNKFYSHYTANSNIYRFSNQCIRCIKENITNTDIEKVLCICQELDIPYIKKEWKNLVKCYPNEKVIGRYISKMQTNNYQNYTFADSMYFNELWAKENS